MMKKLLLLTSVAIALSGCVAASVVGGMVGGEVLSNKVQTGAASGIKDSELAEAAAFALNTTAGNVKIANRQNKTGEVRFVATARGKSHQCYVTTVRTGVFTKHVSDAVCSGSPNAGKGGAGCNALLQAAGRC